MEIVVLNCINLFSLLPLVSYLLFPFLLNCKELKVNNIRTYYEVRSTLKNLNTTQTFSGSCYFLFER